MTGCLHCGADNPAPSRFCGTCGATLSAATVPVGEERKTVTVLFCDVVDSTARADGADPEDVRAALRPYYTRVRTEIERYGGTVEKFIGDAVMAVFGAPTAHEDDAERAVRAALRILAAIADLNAGSELALAVRIGLATGEAVVALGARPELGEGLVAGDVVNIAARLQTVAPVGAIVVDEASYRRTRLVFEYVELEPVLLKGKAEPIRIRQPLAPKARVGELPRPTGPMVGRADEVELLHRIFTRTVRDRSVQLVTVTGEPGVGKSRLIAELGAEIEATPELISWRVGRCLPYGDGVTFWALGEIVKAQAGILESDGPQLAEAKLGTAVESVVDDPAERLWLRGRLAPLVGLPTSSAGTVEREEAFTAWRRFLEGIAAGGPFVIVVEDLHWADPALLAFLEHLVEYAVGVPLLVVATARPELYAQNAEWGGGVRNVTTIALAPLSDVETAHLLADLLQTAVLPAEVQALLLERAGGNPLYAGEFVRMLTDRGLLVRRGRTVGLEGRAVPVPETVSALIAARIDTLPVERKAVLSDAAVLGEVFWAGAVGALGERDAATVLAELHRLTRAEFVRPVRASSVAGQAEYAFTHALVRDVAYGTLPRGARAAKHAAAARWLETIAGDRVADHAEVLAAHYERALELARAAGDDAIATALVEPAARALVWAGDRAMGLDVAAAGMYYQRALELTPAEHPERGRVLAAAAESARQTGELTGAEALFEEAIAVFRSRGNDLAAGAAMTRLSNVVFYQGRNGYSRELLIEAIRLLDQRDAGSELAQAYSEMAGLTMVAGLNVECVTWAEKALELAGNSGLEEDGLRAVGYRGSARLKLGDFAGIDDVQKALHMAIDRGHGRQAAIFYNNLGADTESLEGPAAALRCYLAGIDFTEARGLTHFTQGLRTGTVRPLFDLGRWDELLPVATQVAEWSRNQGYAIYAVEVETYSAQLLAHRGELARAESLVADFLPLARGIGDVQILGPALASAALVARSRGDYAAAAHLASEVSSVTQGPANSYRGLDLPDLIRACLAAANLPLARWLLDDFTPITLRHRHAVVTTQAMLAESAGELEAAADRYAEAAQRWADYGHVLEHGQALLGAGRCLRRLGRVNTTETLRAAREIFAGLAARPLVAEADAELAKATALSS